MRVITELTDEIRESNPVYLVATFGANKTAELVPGGALDQMVYTKFEVDGHPIEKVFGAAIEKAPVDKEIGGKVYGTIMPKKIDTGLFQYGLSVSTGANIRVVEKSVATLKHELNTNPNLVVVLEAYFDDTLRLIDLYHMLRNTPDRLVIFVRLPWHERPHYQMEMGSEMYSDILRITGGEDPDNFFNRMWPSSFERTDEDFSQASLF